MTASEILTKVGDADAGLVTKTKVGQRRTVHLEAEVLDLMTGWIERYRRRAEERYRRLDTVLAEMDPGTVRPTRSATTEPNAERGRAFHA